MYLILYPALQWGIGGLLLAPAEENEPSRSTLIDTVHYCHMDTKYCRQKADGVKFRLSRGKLWFNAILGRFWQNLGLLRCSHKRNVCTPLYWRPSLVVDGFVLALICSAYAEDSIAEEERNFLKFHPSIAIVKVAVLPLLKNKEPLVAAAQELYDQPKLRWKRWLRLNEWKEYTC